ncbi:MAG: hypothetical protein ACI80V_001327 [Rhodothermales bacterium]|jgi:hypothetical protein
MAKLQIRLAHVLLLGLTILIPGAAFAQNSGLAFLGLGPDAAGMGIGDAGVAHTRGAFASERNPAGLAMGRNSEMGVTHHQWISDVSTYGVAGRFNAGSRGGIGLYVRASGSGDIDARDTPGPASGTFDVQFVTAGVGIGQSFGPLSVGVAGKYLSERIFSISATGYAADFGAQLRLADGGVKLGAALLNVGSMDELADRSTELPTTVKAGVSLAPFRILAFDDGATLLDAVLTVEFSRNTVDNRSKMHIGAAASVLETVLLRLGYVSNDALRDFSAGIGISAGTFRIDYAILPFEEGFGGPGHIFSLIYSGGS